MAKDRKAQEEYYSMYTDVDVYPLAQRVTHKKKMANDKRLAKDCINYIDQFHDEGFRSNRREILLENYQLANGNGQQFVERMKEEKLAKYFVEDGRGGSYHTFEVDKINHYPLVNQIIQGLLGEVYKRNLVPMVKDNSRFSKNRKKQRKRELLQEWLNVEFFQPIRQRVLMEMGGPEAFAQISAQGGQEEFQQQIKQREEELTPKHIKNYLQTEYASEVEIMGQKIINHLMDEQRIKDKTDQGFEHGLISMEEYYYVGIRHNRPVMELVNPVFFMWGGGQNTEFVEDAEWAMYEQYITFSDFVNMWGDEVTKRKQWKEIENILTGGSGSDNDEVHREIIGEYAKNPQAFAHIDQATVEGQREIVSLYQHFSNIHGDNLSNYRIRMVHCTWKWNTKAYLVERINIETGEEETFWADEDYVLDPLKGDVKAHEKWIPEVWEGYKFGDGSEGLFLGIQRLPFQHRSPSYPFDAKLPYFGRKYNSLMNNDKNMTLIELGKNFNFDFDREHAQLRRDMAHNVGKIFMFLAEYIPEGWTMPEFIKAIHEHKIAPIHFPEGSLPPQFAAQMFKDIDMSTAVDISQRIQLLRYYQDQTAIAMYYNPSRLGQISPYVPVSNNQQNIVQSANQTEKLFKTHEEIVVRALNGLLNVAKIAAKTDPKYLEGILDDISYGYLQTDMEMLWMSEMSVFVTTNINDIENLQQLKSVALNMSHNEGNALQIAKILEAKSMSEAIKYLEEDQAFKMQMAQQQDEKQMQLQQQQMQMQQMMEQFKSQLKLQEKQIDYQRAIDTARIQNESWVAQYDINQNNINDGVERERAKQAFELTRQQRDQEFSAKENEKDRQLKMKLEKEKNKKKD